MRVYNPAEPPGWKPGLQPLRPLVGPRWTRLVQRANSFGRGHRQPADHVPGPGIPVTQVYQWRVAVPDQHNTPRLTELSFVHSRVETRQKIRRSSAGFFWTSVAECKNV